MSCSPFDLRDYWLRELADAERRQVESHVRSCATCREELERLQLTETTLPALREEEIPQRIAFVSDPIFEPSPVRRFFRDFWGSAARLGFASAAMLSAALVVFALRPSAPAPVAQVAPAPQVRAIAASLSDSEIQARIDAAVAKAVGDAETRHEHQTKRLVADAEQARVRLATAAEELELVQKRYATRALVASAYGPPERELR